MRVYEEYRTPQDKRRAQRDAAPLQRGGITGKARGYTLVFHEDGKSWSGSDCCYNALGNYRETEVGDGPHSLSHCMPSMRYLWDNCRVVGMNNIPAEWRRGFALELYQRIYSDWHEDYNKRYRRFIRAANKEFNLGIKFPKKETANASN